ncbi:60S ribosomal protein L36-2-like protein, partial [Tanacetum coccineum]
GTCPSDSSNSESQPSPPFPDLSGDEDTVANIIAVFGSSSTITVTFGRTSTSSGVTKKELAPRPSDMKEKTSKRVHSVRSLIKEVAGFAPYERRITELLKVGKDKRSLKLAKQNSQEGKEE